MDLLVKGTAHTRMKVIGAKITVSATSDIGRLIKSLKEKKKKKKKDEQIQGLGQ